MMGTNGGALILLLIISSLMLTLPKVETVMATEDSWTNLKPMQQGRGRLGVAAVNGKIYAIGGSTENGYIPGSPGNDYNALGWILATNEEYDPATDTWTFRTPMPTPRFNFAVAVVENKIYCIGGITGKLGAQLNYTQVNEIYDPATDTWETKTPIPDADTGQANVVGDKIYFIGGGSDEVLTQVYNPETDSWTTNSPMPDNVRFQVSAVVDDKIYVIGFMQDLNNYVNSKNFVYDPLTDSWDSGTPLLADTFQGKGVPWRGNWWSLDAVSTIGVMAAKRIYIFFMQYVNVGPLPNLVYNPTTGNWTFGADVPTNRYYFGAVAVNDIIYLIGGLKYDYPFPDDNYFIVTAQPVNEQYLPIGYGTPDPSYVPPDTVAPIISVMSPTNQTYYTTEVPLNFTVNEEVSGMSYSLDGQENVTIIGNTTLTELPNGSHYVIIYAEDVAGNVNSSGAVTFTVNKSNFPSWIPLLTMLIVVALLVAIIYKRSYTKHKTKSY